jgi:hypothetical protein
MGKDNRTNTTDPTWPWGNKSGVATSSSLTGETEFWDSDTEPGALAEPGAFFLPPLSPRGTEFWIVVKLPGDEPQVAQLLYYTHVQ